MLLQIFVCGGVILAVLNCNISEQSQFMTEIVVRDIARWRLSNVRDRYSSKCRMRGSVADPGMKFDTDVVEDLCL